MIVVVGRLAWRPAPAPVPAGRACAIALAAARRGARVEVVGRVGEDVAGEDLVIALARSGVGHAAVLRDPARPTPVAPPPEAASGEDDPLPFADLGPAAIGGGGPPGAAGPSQSASLAGAVSTAGAIAAEPRLDGADIDLALRYLEPSGVVVVADDVTTDVLAVVVEAAEYASARLIVLVPPGGIAARTLPAGIPGSATVLVAPDDDGGGGAFEALVGAYAAALDAGAEPEAAFVDAQSATGWEVAAPD